jgi:hypothetical protein
MWRNILALLCVLLPGPLAGAAQGDAGRGERLFAGSLRLQNGGPACATCHSSASLPFPHGGSLGPDLSDYASRAGSEGVQAVVETLFFPTMVPVFRDRPLTVTEQADLQAFFERSGATPPVAGAWSKVLGVAVLGCLLLLGVSAWIWRARLRGVRAPLVERTRREERSRR